MFKAFRYRDIEEHKFWFRWEDRTLHVILASSGGDAGEARGPGREAAFERLLLKLVEQYPGVRVAATRNKTLANRIVERLDAPLPDCRDVVLEARKKGGANRFDLWLEDVANQTIEEIARAVGLDKHENQRAQPTRPNTLSELLPTSETTLQPLNVGGTPLPKAFVLLAGISGTGKTSFVREQAARMGMREHNFELIPVRPDWHEPSELLGHLTRINGERFVATPFLKFIADCWKAAAATADADAIHLRALDEIPTFWACLDEMNLAPVEQYFADYLSVLETRRWDEGRYTSDAILRLDGPSFTDAVRSDLRKQLDLAAPDHDGLWQHFCAKGIPLPPNLVVAGTVNMDETTHGFSRKVIDRAFTLDFGAFFPTDFSTYFAPSKRPITFTFPRRSRITRGDLAESADPDGSRTIAFLEDVNAVLGHTTFELAYRALNELLLAVHAFAPKDSNALQAVWDDFLMTKVLPRLEGDAEKLRLDGGASLLTHLRDKTDQALGARDGALRPDLFHEPPPGGHSAVDFRARRALTRMHERLVRHNFTSFWP